MSPGRAKWVLLAIVGGLLAMPASGAATAGLELGNTTITPADPYFDGAGKIRLRYRIRAEERRDLEIRVVEASSGNTARVWRERRARPGARLVRSWDGLNRRGKAARDGRYEFLIRVRGRQRQVSAGRFTLRGHRFPVDGPHGERGAVGRFGAARNGGRVHEGFDILAACGTPLVAARGGKVVKASYDDALYGHYLLIDGRKTGEDYFYSHLIAPSRFARGERVRTGQRVGRVGRTGNARSTPCHLHFEIRDHGNLVDPEPALNDWDRWS